MASPNNTLIELGQSITDASGNVWSINNGQVTVNGAVDPTTANVTHLAYADGLVWQENTDDLWWSKTTPASGWSPDYGTSTVPVPITASADDTLISAVNGTTTPAITDASGNTWTIANGLVVVNGAVDPTTANVTRLAYANGLVWQENADNLWWSKTSPGAAWIQSTTSGPPVPIPNVSPNEFTITAGGASAITDQSGNRWSLVYSYGKEYVVAVNGRVDASTANVIKMTIVDQVIWQENTAGEWYSKTTPASQWSARTFTDPVSGAVDSASPVWIGSGTNLATDATAWSTGVAPKAGEFVLMKSGTMNVSGTRALAGDTLNVDLATANPYAGGTANINLTSDATLSMNVHTNGGFLNVSGGTVRLTGASSFSAYHTVFADTLNGTGTLSLSGANAHGELMELNGKVGSGLTFIIDRGGANDASLQIDHPADFHAMIDLTAFSSPAVIGLDHIGLLGLTATRGELLNGILKLFNANTLVDTVRVKGGDLQLLQNSTGVMLTVGSLPDPTGTVIPLHVG